MDIPLYLNNEMEKTFTWTPKAVTKSLEAVCRRCAFMFRRANWFAIVSESTVAWKNRNPGTNYRGPIIRLDLTGLNRLRLLFQYGTRSGQRFKTFFGCSADRATPIFGRIVKFGSFGNLTFSVPPIGVVYTSTIDCLALIHLLRVGHRNLLRIRGSRKNNFTF
jgi:hypothetical protein